MTVDTINVTSRLDRLDLPTKVRILTGETSFTLYGNTSIDLAPMAFSDGPTGVRGIEFSGGPTTCLFPNATLLASTWSPEILGDVGRLLAEEAARQQIHVVLGPTINLHRSPLGGRVFEAYSEDPLLTGVLAAAYVNGLQAEGVGACLKHLVANEAETERHTVNSQVDQRTLREVYLLPFQIAVEDSDPWTIMAAYNDVNGVAATEHDEINNGIVKSEWGWTGLLMSDWYATKTTAPSANGGLDLVMPGPNGPWGEALLAAVGAGEVAEATIDDHVARLLRLAERVGALGTPRSWPDVPSPDSDIRREQLTRISASGMIVLENRGALPLAGTERVALIGRHALDTVCMGGGSSLVRAPHQVSIADGLRARLDDRLTVADGVNVRSRQRPARPGLLTDPVTGEPGVRVRIHTESGETLAEWIADDNRFDVHGVDYPGTVVRAELRAVVANGPQTIGAIGVGDWVITVGEHEQSASLQTETGDLAEAILRPPGIATDVVIETPTEIIARVTAPLADHNAFGLVAETTPLTDDENISAAVAAAANADIAVVVVGLTDEQESEALDKHTLALPGRQDELVTAVAAAAKRTVVIVNAATPVLMPWRDQVDAVVVVGLPGQEGGHAVAAALLNEIEPAGRLVTTYPTHDGANPAWEVTPTDGVLAYSEGSFVGYRGHAAGRAPEPAYWFGDGTGYGEFEYGPPTVDIDSLTVDVTVTNSARFDSREVVQIYFDPQTDNQPVRLVGWGSALIPAGGETHVRVECDSRLWRTWDAESHMWTRLPGGELIIARGLGDIRHRIALD